MKELEDLVESLHLGEHISLQEIPGIDLYMDQLITLFESKLGHTRRSDGDKLLTKTMINNYTKDKVLMPATKKKYTKDHIVLMILLYQLKNIISIGDIKDTFAGLKDEEGGIHSDQLEKLYLAYLKGKEREVKQFEQSVASKVEEVKEDLGQVGDIDERLQDVLMVQLLIEQASYYKRLAEKIIDERINNKKMTLS